MRGFALLAALLLAAPAPSRAADVTAAEFFVVLRAPDGTENFYRSTVVPLIPDQACYGWRVRLADVEGLVTFREVFSLPDAPTFWGGEDDEYSTNNIAKDRKTSVTERFVHPDEGWVSNVWCVAKGDPQGTYTMDVSVAGKFVKRFEFVVRKP